MPEITLDDAIKAPKDIGFDFETTGLNWLVDRPLFLGLGRRGSNPFSGYINLQKYSPDTLSVFFKDFFKSHRPILQDAKFDFHVLSKYLSIDAICSIDFADTMLLSQIIDENRSHGLDSMTELWIGPEYLEKKRAVDVYIAEHRVKKIGKNKDTYDWGQIPSDSLGSRGEEDAINTAHMYQLLRPRLSECNVYDLEKKLTRVLLRVEHNGSLIDKEYLEKLKMLLEEKIKTITDKHPGVDLASSKDRSEYLFKTLGLTAKAFTPKKNQPKSDNESLALIDHPAAKDIIEFSNLSHTLATYVQGFLDKMDALNLIHCTFRQMGARTGRMSCVNPNLQQLPKEGQDGEWVKTGFIGDVTTYDYSQMEAILYAFDSKEQEMIDYLAADKKADLYKWLAQMLYAKKEISKPERGLCKGLFLGRIYGMGNAKFLKQSQGLNPEATEKFFGRLRDIQKGVTKQIETNGYIETIIGRKRHLEYEDAYKGLNARIQGSAADIIKTVMVNLPLSLQNKLMVQVHDELVFRGLDETEKKLIAEMMCDFKPFDLRVGYGSGENWWKAYQQKELNEKAPHEKFNDANIPFKNN
jgi:DNA polymerase I